MVSDQNSIDSYVRIIITKYWTDSNNEEDDSLNLDFIEVNINEDSGWFIDENASTPTRLIAYYENILPTGEETPAAIDSIRINSNLQNEYEVSKNGNNVSIANKYDNHFFNIEIEANAIQSHNAVDAAVQHWGVNINIDSSGKLTLV